MELISTTGIKTCMFNTSDIHMGIYPIFSPNHNTFVNYHSSEQYETPEQHFNRSKNG